ncbi:MAG: FlgO family outer membrane protein [Acidobacteriota bacterium]
MFGILVVLSTAPLSAQKLLADGIRDLSDQVTATVTKEKKQRLAIVPLRELSGQPTLLGAYLSEELTTSLVQAGSFQVVERSQLDRILAELKLDRSGLVDAESAKKVGKFLGADAILTGTITELSTYVGVNCRIIDGLTGEVRGAAGVKIAKDADVNKIMATAKPVEDNPDQGSAQKTQDTASKKSRFLEAANGFTFELKSCSATGTSVECNLQITSSQTDRSLRLFAGGSGALRTHSPSRLIDTNGNEFKASKISLGVNGGIFEALSTLVAGVPVVSSVTFSAPEAGSRWGGQNPTASQATPAAIASLIEVIAYSPNENFSVRFRNVPIQIR